MGEISELLTFHEDCWYKYMYIKLFCWYKTTFLSKLWQKLLNN